MDVDGKVEFDDFLVLADQFNTDLNDSSCSCGSSSALTGRDGGTIFRSLTPEQHRQRDLGMFQALRAGGASDDILAMGLALLELTWEKTGAEEDWWRWSKS